MVYMYNLEQANWTFMANYDYVHGDRLILGCSTDDESCYPYNLSKPVYLMGRRERMLEVYAFDDKNYVAARYEYYYDNRTTTSRTFPPGV